MAMVGVLAKTGRKSSISSTALLCRWEEAKVLWAIGGPARMDALFVAKRLRDQLRAAEERVSTPVAQSSRGSYAGESVSRDHAALQVRLLTTLGGWMDTLKCESVAAIKSELDMAVYLGDELGVGDVAVGDALLGLGIFYERQYNALKEEAESSTYARFVSVNARTRDELQRVRDELGRLEPTKGKTQPQDNNEARRSNLKRHERELRLALEGDSLEDVAKRNEYLLNSVENYLLCLRRSSFASPTSRTAAAAVCRLWMRGRSCKSLSDKIHDAFTSGLDAKPLLPFTFQLIARIDGIESGSTSTASAAFQRALRELLLSISMHDNDGAVIQQLLVAAQPRQPNTGISHNVSSRSAGHSTKTAASALLEAVRSVKADDVDAITTLSKALQHLASCKNPGKPAAPSSGINSRNQLRETYIAIDDAVATADARGESNSSCSTLLNVARLHEKINLADICVPVTRPTLEGATMVRYLPNYLPVASGRLNAQGPGQGPYQDVDVSAKLIWCEDDAGVLHTQLLKTRSDGTLDVRRDMLVCQTYDELNQILHAEPQARRRKIRLRTCRALALAPSIGLYEWRPHTESVQTFLATEHSLAYREGRDKLRLSECVEIMHQAQVADASVGRGVQSDSILETFGSSSGGSSANSAAKGWCQVTGSISPLLHRYLLRHSTTTDAWLSRRLTFARSVATSSIAGWLVGLGERSPHRILLDQTTAEVMHIGLQAILLQQPASSKAELLSASEQIPPPSSASTYRKLGAQPEHGVPFRLTRELMDALGPAGVEGAFQRTAEVVLGTAQRQAAAAALLTCLEVIYLPTCRCISVASPLLLARGAIALKDRMHIDSLHVPSGRCLLMSPCKAGHRPLRA